MSKNSQALSRTAVQVRSRVSDVASSTGHGLLPRPGSHISEIVANGSASELRGGARKLSSWMLLNAGQKLRASVQRSLHCCTFPQSAPERVQRIANLSYWKTAPWRCFHSATSVCSQASAFAVVDEERIEVTANARTPSGEEGLEIAKLSISPLVINGLARRGITKLFPVQRAVLEPAMQGQDLIARAKTGTGKTLAFGIPILDGIVKENSQMSRGYGKAPLAIVMAPTRELAKQVETEFKASVPTMDVLCVYGGVSIDGQIRQLQRGVDVAVGTPGRIIDLLKRGALNLNAIKYVVLDEADRMLAVGFVEPIQEIFQHLPVQKQSLLFSATMPDWVKDLAGRFLKNHLVVDLVGHDDQKLAEGIKLLSVCTSMIAKRAVLSDLITVYGKRSKTIIFIQTKRDVDDVARSLNMKIPCEPLHGDISQAQRERTLKSFRDGRLSILVATDVAARGLDIQNVDLVIHYDVANDTETFVHRSGRTGRAGKQGTAILMHTQFQMRTLNTLERELGCRFQQIDPPSSLDLLRSSADHATAKLQNVHADVKNIFLPTAKKLLEEQGPRALAGAIAHVCGLREAPASRSLISYESGVMTLKITSPSGPGITSAAGVTQVLSKLHANAAFSLGKVCMLNDREGAVFDLPEKMAKEILALKIESGEVIESIEKLPPIEEEPYPTGRPPMQRGFGGRSGGAFGGGGYNRSSYSGYGGGGSNYRSPSAFGGGDWSSRSSGNSGPSSWGAGSSGSNSWGFGNSGSSSWGTGSSSSSTGFPSSSGGSGNRYFAGQCLHCGQSGHRAVDCPNKPNFNSGFFSK